jgi:hypothetical protein
MNQANPYGGGGGSVTHRGEQLYGGYCGDDYFGNCGTFEKEGKKANNQSN